MLLNFELSVSRRKSITNLKLNNISSETKELINFFNKL